MNNTAPGCCVIDGNSASLHLAHYFRSPIIAVITVKVFIDDFFVEAKGLMAVSAVASVAIASVVVAAVAVATVTSESTVAVEGGVSCR